MDEQALTTIEKPNLDVVVGRPPAAILAEARVAAQALEEVLKNKKNPVMFNGQQYLEFEDWQTIGKFYGLAVRTEKAEFFEIEQTSGARASAIVYHATSGKIMGSAEAWCLRDEPNWRSKPWFQLASMAQTRAGAKALRNLLSWVIVLAGYGATPAEELASDHKIQKEHESTTDVKKMLLDMSGQSIAQADVLLKKMTTWKDRKTGEEKSIAFKDLDGLRDRKPEWYQQIANKVQIEYDLFQEKGV